MTSVRAVGPFPPPMHGAARVTDDVTRRLRQRGPVVAVDTNDGVSAGVRLARLLRGILVTAWGRPGRGSLYVGGAGGELIWYQALVVLAARLMGRTAAFHHHNFSYLHDRSRAMAFLVRAGGPRLIHVVLGDTMAVRLQDLYPAARTVRVCSNAGLMAPTEPDAAGSPADAAGAVVLGHLSNLTLEKGLADVVASFDRAIDAGLDVRLVLAGPCANPDAQEVVDDAVARHPDRLIAPGRLDGSAVDAFYRDIDLFVFPSTYVNEAEPLVVLDALRHGVPAVAYDTGCVGELVEPSHLVERGGDLPGTVTAAAQDLLTDADSADRARARFEARRRRAVDAYDELFTTLV